MRAGRGLRDGRARPRSLELVFDAAAARGDDRRRCPRRTARSRPAAPTRVLQARRARRRGRARPRARPSRRRAGARARARRRASTSRSCSTPTGSTRSPAALERPARGARCADGPHPARGRARRGCSEVDSSEVEARAPAPRARGGRARRARSSCSRATTRSSPRPAGRVASAAAARRRSPPPAPATCSPGVIARDARQGPRRRSTPRAPGVALHAARRPARGARRTAADGRDRLGRDRGAAAPPCSRVGSRGRCH